MQPTVFADKLAKRFGSIEAVRDISLHIEPGQCFGFLGPNGAGKTSTMRMIGCVSPPSGGTLHVLGLDATRQSRAIKRRLGVVPQDDNLDHYLSARENLHLYGRYFDLHGRALAARVEAMLEFVQLTDRAATEVRTLSGGMRRRLLIARALISNPELIILDEPTTGLDPQARHLLWERLRILREEKRTLLVSTHYMDEAQQLCDALVIMEDGRIIAQGAPAALIEQHVTREVIEFIGPHASREALQQLVENKAVAVEMLQDRLLIFCHQADGLLPDLARQFGGAGRILARRSSLEDVYLKITGRRLQES